MSHYFITDDTLEHEIREIVYHYKGNRFTFLTDNGVFSKDKVDDASDLLLRNLPPLGGTLLDLGCGYGCIGTVLAKAYPQLAVTLSDVNERALKLAEQNARRNQVTVHTVLSDRFEHLPGCYDTILLNPPIHAGKAVVYDLYQQAYDHLNPGGVFYIVIQKKHGAASSEKKLREIFGGSDTVYHKKEYYIFAGKKTV